jgi:hypothetical protein
MTEISKYSIIIALNVKGLKISDWKNGVLNLKKKKKDPTVCCLKCMHFTGKDKYLLKVKR